MTRAYWELAHAQVDAWALCNGPQWPGLAQAGQSEARQKRHELSGFETGQVESTGARLRRCVMTYTAQCQLPQLARQFKHTTRRLCPSEQLCARAGSLRRRQPARARTTRTLRSLAARVCVCPHSCCPAAKFRKLPGVPQMLKYWQDPDPKSVPGFEDKDKGYRDPPRRNAEPDKHPVTGDVALRPHGPGIAWWRDKVRRERLMKLGWRGR